MKALIHQQTVSFESLYQAYKDCRKRKRGTANAQRYDMQLLDKLFATQDALNTRSYSPSRSIRFVAEKPKAREIHAADFQDRVVHHWLVPQLERLFEPVFIHDVYSNRKGKGIHKAVKRLQAFMHQNSVGRVRNAARQCSQTHSACRMALSLIRPTIFQSGYGALPRNNHSQLVPPADHGALPHNSPAWYLVGRATRKGYRAQPSNKRNQVVGWGEERTPTKEQPHDATAWYLQLDIKNFFNTIDCPVLFKLIQHRLKKSIKQQKTTKEEAATLRWLCHVLLKHDTTENAIYRGDPALLNRVPAYKQLGNGGNTKGLPIGNLTSQFFANLQSGDEALPRHKKVGSVPLADNGALPHNSIAWYLGGRATSRGYRAEPCNQRGLTLIPKWKPDPADIVGYRTQVLFFQQQFPCSRLSVQRGMEVDTFFPLKQMVGVTKEPQLIASVSHIIIRENGYLKGGLKRRQISKLFIKPGVELCPTQGKS